MNVYRFYNEIINIFIATIDEFNVSLLNKSITFLLKQQIQQLHSSRTFER